MDQESFQTAQVMFRRMRDDRDRPDTFSLLGREWDLLPGVFGPNYTPATEILTGWLDYPTGGSFLEIGCGAGVTAVCAALAGCRVTALDISAAAVENTRRNAARHGVADRVRVEYSDLFAALGPGERYDLVYWQSNFIEAPQGFANDTDLHHSFFDPGYAAHQRFVREVPAHVAPGGRVLLGFNIFGNRPLLDRHCAEAGMAVSLENAEHRTVRAVVDGVEVTREVTFQLLELRPTGGRSWSQIERPTAATSHSLGSR